MNKFLKRRNHTLIASDSLSDTRKGYTYIRSKTAPQYVTYGLIMFFKKEEREKL